jgi:small subunit ribosomal protein S20
VPNKKSAIKRVRQNERRRIHNRAKRSDMRTAVKKARLAAETGNLENIDQLVADAHRKLGKAAKTNLVKKETAARHISRLMKAVNKARAAKSEAAPAS